MGYKFQHADNVGNNTHLRCVYINTMKSSKSIGKYFKSYTQHKVGTVQNKVLKVAKFKKLKM